MSNFAKGNNSKNSKGNNRKKNKITFFLKSSLGYLLIILVCSKLLAVRVFEISSFQCSNLQRAMTEFLFKFSPGNLHPGEPHV